MKILNDMVRKTSMPVQIASISIVRGARAKIMTPKGPAWAKLPTGMTVKAGERVSFARIGDDFQILSLSPTRRSETKTVRV